MSQRRQGLICIAIGLAAVLIEIFLLLLDKHYDSFQEIRAPVVAASGVLLIVIGVLRMRGKITK